MDKAASRIRLLYNDYIYIVKGLHLQCKEA